MRQRFLNPFIGTMLAIEILLAVEFIGCGTKSTSATSVGRPLPVAVNTPSFASPKSDTQLAEQFSLPDPSPSQPVLAAMKCEPPIVAAGDSAELIVYVRIARVHYIHASDDVDSTFSPIEMRATLPKELQAEGNWRYPQPAVEKAGRRVFRNALLLRCPVKVNSDAPASTLVVNGQLSVQVCTEELCWPPQSIEVSAPVTIQSRGR